MSALPTKQSPLAVDISVLLKRSDGPAPQYAAVDRELVELLLAIKDANSVLAACEKRCMSPRNAQRLLKRFTERCGIEPLRHLGPNGTTLSEEGEQCIALYAAARHCAERIAKESGFPHPSTP